MTEIKQPIIPSTVVEVQTKAKTELDLKAICIFTAIGFFLDTDTYWKNKKVLKPACTHRIDADGILMDSKPYFKWHYTPRNISFNKALEEFTELFENILKEQTQNQKVILPLSGGLDSRTQATGLHYINAEVQSYSYAFKNGFNEVAIAKQIASVCQFPFKAYTISDGYLWNKLGELVALNGCYSDFTSPRQMAIVNEFKAMGDVFSLGHWGDVLFDNYGVPQLSEQEELQFLSKKLLKKGGLELAEDLWKHWNLDGEFKDYLNQRLSDLLKTIDIKNSNPKLRAFKSKYWAPRWTSVNLAIFQSQQPIALPYYDDRMCQWLCTIPEEYLVDRKIQIEYIKKRNPSLAKIMWQDKRPYNLYTYQTTNKLVSWCYRIGSKAKRSWAGMIGNPYIQRNWELQFNGKANEKKLRVELEQTQLKEWVGEHIQSTYLEGFYRGEFKVCAHGLNMLLTLAKFHQKHHHGEAN
ncbi:asparagine synthase-related protein [Winogradskyella maritima]|uniref:asparagine synthase (glutamine-hydrolyzing) n=1 Tax=Winogradskyella maritima TaxID=1517766 RepID=A0ABV8AKY1_9FLAO|nr:asparagine synthase-related protein [Winogradskyella maritima]